MVSIAIIFFQTLEIEKHVYSFVDRQKLFILINEREEPLFDFRIKQANATVPCKPTHPNVTVTLRQLESWTVGVKDNLHNNVIQVCCGKKKC